MEKPKSFDISLQAIMLISNVLFQSIVYYTVRSPKLETWLNNEAIEEALRPTLDASHVDFDPTFNMHVDEDFDSSASGVSRNSFCNTYLDWIQHCASRRDEVRALQRKDLCLRKHTCGG